jgi:hypothetical protein
MNISIECCVLYGCEPQLASYPMVTGNSFPRDEAADLSPPTGAEVKGRRIYTATPHTVLLVKRRDNFTFNFCTD